MAKGRNNQNIGVKLRDNEVVALRDTMSSIPDRRKAKNPRYPIDVMIALLIYATLCNYGGATGTAKYCKLHANYFKKLFGLKGTPSAPTFGKVISSLDPEEIANLLPQWAVNCSLDIREKYKTLCDISAYEKKERKDIEKLEMKLRDTEIDDLQTALALVSDYRKARGVRYPLIALIIMALYAAMCGYTKSKEIEAYCLAHADYFTAKFNLKRTPSHDTFDRMKTLLNPMKLALPLELWIRTCYPDTRKRFKDMLILHIDGKAIRAAGCKQAGGAVRYILNAMYEGESIGLKVKVIGDKKNEILVIPEYLKDFDLRNTIITADAAATTEAVIRLIVAAGGHYVLPIKGNQSGIEDQIISKINTLLTTPAKNPTPKIVTRFDELEHVTYKPKKNHGRQEEIVCTLIGADMILKELIEDKPFLSSATYVAVIDKKSTKMEKGKEVTTTTRRIFIVSLKNVTPSDVRKIVAGHWHIEMDHWLLDIQLREDSMTSRKGYAMEFGAVLRRLVLAICKHTSKQPINIFMIHNQAHIERIEKFLSATAIHSGASGNPSYAVS